MRGRKKVKGRKNKQRKHRNKLVKIQQLRLSFQVCKHVRYVLEEDTKDDSWSSSFGPEHSNGAASKLSDQPVSPTAPAAATSETTQQLLGGCTVHVQAATCWKVTAW